MSRERQLIVCCLNIAATPHPEGTYVALLRRASNYLVRARGDEFAKITSPTQDMRFGRYWAGRILLWTEIDLKGHWLDLTSGEELSDELKQRIQIPGNAKPNYRSFDYVLDNNNHSLFFEIKNEEGQTFGPSVAFRVFVRLMSREIQGLEAPEVEVTLVPETGVVDRVLALPGLRTLYIRVVRPNADISDAARRRVLGRLEEAHAQREEITLTKSAGAAALTPTEDIRETAAVASENGLVRGEGRDANGVKVGLSTSDQPKRYYVGIDSGPTLVTKLFSLFGRH